ncbi:MAG: sigma-70 family RNA polymerase sigma factor [Clostridia bacterium]|nr:sigma-70 family RNA polymerase sigma factor [Clostridia bacterium]
MLSFFLCFIDDEQQRIRFENLYLTYRKQMIRTVLRYIKNEDDAESVVNDVFLEIATRHMSILQRIPDPDDLRTYLLKAAKYRALNELKFQKQGVSFQMVEAICHLTDEQFLDYICARIDRSRAVDCLMELDDQYRDVLYYHLTLGLSVADTAKCLGQSFEATKKQLTRGKKMLLDLVDEKGGYAIDQR